MSSDEEEETDNVFLNECVDDEINNSDDSQTDMNVEDDTDFSSAPAPKKKKQQKYKEGRRSQTRWSYHPLNQYWVVSTNVNDNSNMVLGMSSHFLNFLFKTSQYHQMKALNKRISEWPHVAL